MTKRKKINAVDAETLERADGFYRRAVRERKFRAKNGKRIKVIAAIYNLMAIGMIKEYKDLTFRLSFGMHTK
jgi:hypothetical protein